MNENKLELEFKYSIEESITATKEITQRASSTGRYIPYIGIFLVVCYIILSFLTGDFSGPLIPLIMGLIFIFMPFLVTLEAKRKFKNSPLANKNLKYIIDSNAIEMNTNGVQSKITWDNLNRAVKVKKGYLFFTSSRAAHWIPVSALNPESEKILIEIIKDKGIKFK